MAFNISRLEKITPEMNADEERPAGWVGAPGDSRKCQEEDAEPAKCKGEKAASEVRSQEQGQHAAETALEKAGAEGRQARRGPPQSRGGRGGGLSAVVPRTNAKSGSRGRVLITLLRTLLEG